MPTVPTSLSTLGSVNIFLDPREGYQENTTPIIPQIVTIGATQAVLHYFGTIGAVRRLKFRVYSVANKNTLKGYADAGTTVNLTTHRGSQGNFVMLNFVPVELQALNYADAWYLCTCDLVPQ